MRTITLSDGTALPQVGMGTWRMGETPALAQQEAECLRRGIASGIRLIDTAEDYGKGASEALVGRAIQGEDRSKLFLLTKIMPPDFVGGGFRRHCLESLERLGTAYLDLYLIHWCEPGLLPHGELAAGMEELVTEGLIRRWGVSNFDIQDMRDLWSVPMGDRCLVNQVLYNLGTRGVEYRLLPWMREHRVTMIAYSPLAHSGELREEYLRNPALKRIAAKHGVTVMQVLLAFTIAQGGVIAIPKAGSPAHMEQNLQAAGLTLDREDLLAIDGAYPPPTCGTPLEIL